MTRCCIAVALALVPVMALSATTGEEDAITINRINGPEFEVVSGSFVGGAEYFWCGAATYVLRRTNRSGQTPVYIKRPIGPSTSAPGRKSVVFSTSNAGLPAPKERLTLTLKERGATLKAGNAQSYCRDAFTRSTK